MTREKVRRYAQALVGKGADGRCYTLPGALTPRLPLPDERGRTLIEIRKATSSSPEPALPLYPWEWGLGGEGARSRHSVPVHTIHTKRINNTIHTNYKHRLAPRKPHNVLQTVGGVLPTPPASPLERALGGVTALFIQTSQSGQSGQTGQTSRTDIAVPTALSEARLLELIDRRVTLLVERAIAGAVR